ncbi:hypothetical protein HKO22_09675 [Peptoniphilus sp. AGMB00490]|uniref:Uncharacterized protein n=1 Tax=Peptoniphilus faecalis TaxID=2731255 RepID=A0A848RJH4_9FIRM|nr:hypothetical protein [Peptoniphilus faecalis]NMW85991.1 hypothetical protein [Peptoniphilus faecalis]
MTSREYLEQIKHLDKEIMTNKAMIESLEDSIKNHKDKEILNEIKRLKDEIKRLKDEIKNRLIYIAKVKKVVIKEIYKINNSFSRTILLNHYVNGLTLKDIANITHFSYGYIKNRHIKALSEFENCNKEKINKIISD